MKQFGLLLAVGLLFAMVLPVPASGQEDRPQPMDFKVERICLKAGNSVEAAQILDEWFNNSRTNGKPRIVVLAVPLTNCLLVKATSTDLLIIRRLLKPI
jgi:hypothetical protein